MIEFLLLGSLDLKGSEGETFRSVLAQPKCIALLTYLAVAKPKGFHRRDKLIGLFWAEQDQDGFSGGESWSHLFATLSNKGRDYQMKETLRKVETLTSGRAGG